jgi:Radial spoke protein 3
VFAKTFLKNVQKDALGVLEAAGLFEDLEVKQVKDSFMPWLYGEVKQQLQQHTKFEHLVDSSFDLIRKD